MYDSVSLTQVYGTTTDLIVLYRCENIHAPEAAISYFDIKRSMLDLYVAIYKLTTNKWGY